MIELDGNFGGHFETFLTNLIYHSLLDLYFVSVIRETPYFSAASPNLSLVISEFPRQTPSQRKITSGSFQRYLSDGLTTPSNFSRGIPDKSLKLLQLSRLPVSSVVRV